MTATSYDRFILRIAGKMCLAVSETTHCSRSLLHHVASPNRKDKSLQDQDSGVPAEGYASVEGNSPDIEFQSSLGMKGGTKRWE
jgi:hypothetical protein